MRHLRKIGLLFSLATAMISVILLLNIAAPNPTGRRYSSEAPIRSSGADAERILGNDLRLPNNNGAGQQKCLCSAARTGTPGSCRVCVGQFPLNATVNYRRPDFINDRLIAESKNQILMTRSARDFLEVQDYATAAKKMGIPLYLYIRVDTEIDPAYYPMIEATGGAVIRYFTTSGYIDPVDRGAQGGLIVAGSVGGLCMVVRRRPARTITIPASVRVPVRRAASPLDKSRNAIHTAEEFQERTRRDL